MLLRLGETGLCGHESLEVSDGKSRRQIEGEDVLLEAVARSDDRDSDSRPYIAGSNWSASVFWSSVVQMYSHSCLYWCAFLVFVSVLMLQEAECSEYDARCMVVVAPRGRSGLCNVQVCDAAAAICNGERSEVNDEKLRHRNGSFCQH